MPIPLAPLIEQHRIVAEFERQLSVIEELEIPVESNLKRAGRLRQSLLRAFLRELDKGSPLGSTKKAEFDK
jgi:type I restriction enzyme, S subunit